MILDLIDWDQSRTLVLPYQCGHERHFSCYFGRNSAWGFLIQNHIPTILKIFHDILIISQNHVPGFPVGFPTFHHTVIAVRLERNASEVSGGSHGCTLIQVVQCGGGVPRGGEWSKIDAGSLWNVDPGWPGLTRVDPGWPIKIHESN